MRRADRSRLVGNDVNGSLVLFFVLLLTVITVLYDRFLGDRLANPAFS